MLGTISSWLPFATSPARLHTRHHRPLSTPCISAATQRPRTSGAMSSNVIGDNFRSADGSFDEVFSACSASSRQRRRESSMCTNNARVVINIGGCSSQELSSPARMISNSLEVEKQRKMKQRKVCTRDSITIR